MSTSFNFAFSSATFSASSEISIAYTSAFKYFAKEIAIQPLPLPTSSILSVFPLRTSSSTRCATLRRQGGPRSRFLDVPEMGEQGRLAERCPAHLNRGMGMTGNPVPCSQRNAPGQPIAYPPSDEIHSTPR